MKAYDMKRGTVVEHDGRIWQIKDTERSAPQGRGGNTTYRIIMYSVPGNVKLDISLRAEDDMPEVELTRRPATFSYMDGDAFVFLDTEDFTPYTLDPGLVGDNAGYITEGLEECFVRLLDESPIGLQLPPNVTLQVVETAPELRGATATKRPKPARLNTGIEIMVPEYVVNGERILVSTTTGEFAGRA
jgi:elongation factor P